MSSSFNRSPCDGPPKVPKSSVLRVASAARLGQFVDLLESGERNSRGHACATKHSSETDLKGPSVGH
jgi:hypothetical protein